MNNTLRPGQEDTETEWGFYAKGRSVFMGGTYIIFGIEIHEFYSKEFLRCFLKDYLLKQYHFCCFLLKEKNVFIVKTLVDTGNRQLPGY